MIFDPDFWEWDFKVDSLGKSWFFVKKCQFLFGLSTLKSHPIHPNPFQIPKNPNPDLYGTSPLNPG